MIVEIVKSKKDMLIDNMRILLTGVRGAIILGLVVLSVLFPIFGVKGGAYLILIPLIFLGISMFSTYSILKKVEGSEARFEYQLYDDRISIINPMGHMEVMIRDIIALKRMKSFTIIGIKVNGNRMMNLPMYTSGVKSGNMNRFVDQLESSMKKTASQEMDERNQEENEKPSSDVEDKKIDENTYENIEEDVSEDVKDEKNLNGEELHEETQEAVQEENQEEIKEGIQEESEEDTKEELVVRGEESLELKDESPEKDSLEEVQEKNEYIQMRSILKFENKLKNDISRQYKMMFSKPSIIFILFAFGIIGFQFFYSERILFGSIFGLLTLAVIAAPLLDAISGWREHKGVISMAIDEHEYLVINNGEVVQKVHKKDVAVGKTTKGEIILSVLNRKNRPIGVNPNEIIEGDPYELFKLFSVGKVMDFNWFGVGALGLASIAVCQIPLNSILGDGSFSLWSGIIGIIIALVSGVMGYFGLREKDRVKKQASWAVLLDTVIIVYYIVMFIKM